MIKAIILAAGKGTRLKTNKPKGLVKVLGKSLINYVIDSIKDANLNDIYIVTGYKEEAIKRHLGTSYKYITQKVLDGTGGALKVALKNIKDNEGLLLVTNTDTPLITSHSLKRLISYAKRLHLDGCCLSSLVDQPEGYGRILRNQNKQFIKIIEESELDSSECFKEINAGAYVFNMASVRKVIDELEKKKNAEYYLTELFEIMSKQNMKIEAVQLQNLNEAFGVNRLEDLVRVNLYMKNKIIEHHILNGVNIIDPTCTLIEPDVEIGEETVIMPFSVVRRFSKIGKNCEIGPFAHIRGDSTIDDDSIIGNFVEINRSAVSKHTKIKHLSYIGDATLGKDVNIGAGTITANYDGVKKSKTIMEDGASTGSNSVLVAPVTMGKGSKTGAGAVVRRNTRIKPQEIYIGVPAKPLKKGGT